MHCRGLQWKLDREADAVELAESNMKQLMSAFDAERKDWSETLLSGVKTAVSKAPVKSFVPSTMCLCHRVSLIGSLSMHIITITHSQHYYTHNTTITCTCCDDEINGIQDQDLFSCSFSSSL